jgi:dipeptidyl aminopeptidase/acylaminoacyl peptidase
MKSALLFLFIHLPYFIFAQSNKETLDHSTYDIWNTIQNVRITNDGNWVAYQLQPGEGDPTLKLVDKNGDERGSYERSNKAAFSWDSEYLIWRITAPLDTLKAQRRRQVEKEDLPKDTLAILSIPNQTIEKIPNVKAYQLPEEWSGHLAYLLEQENIPVDTTISDSLRVTPKPNDEENGFTLVLRNLLTSRQDTFRYVVDYQFSKYNQQLVFQSSGDSTILPGIYHFDCKRSKLNPLFRKDGKYSRLIIDEQGQKVAFMADLDTSEHTIRYYDIYFWEQSQDSALMVLDTTQSFVPRDWLINEKDTLYFSENGEKLFFSVAPEPTLPDTTLLEEEIVNVEVWTYKDPRLYTQQKIEVEKDSKKGFLCWFDTENDRFVQLANEEMPEIITADEGNSDTAIGMVNEQYLKFISWEGSPLRNDFYTVDMQSGNSEKILTNMRSYQYGLSPKGKYFYWIDTRDSCWYAYSIERKEAYNLTTEIPVSFTSEIHDAPTPPYPYGLAGWTEKDEYILIYDRYDIWKLDPTMKEPPINLTKGRSEKKVYRYLKMDPRDRWINSKKPLLLHTYDEISRDEGYANLRLNRNSLPEQVIEGSYHFSRPRKALYDQNLVYTKESFQVFPDLLLSDITFESSQKISNANPQQDEYQWGTAEIVNWTSLDGEALEGMLFKPEDFNPDKQYPMIVNFYEKSSKGLHRHRHPKTERSTINYSLYVSNGYIVFNPDVHYRIGYPGESCYNSVIPGVTKLIEEGFVDKDHIGVQGHSWGGYQIAYLVTKTDMFAAAEAGAPVPNMISAYGGIRWWTGLSRMFQYEHTQSRIGGTLWEYPIRFIENSPIFFVDKINTPLLIMHNDADGHVPWYQGIELFVALRRLGKPSWMLNYPGEPHWPLKRQNQLDFNIRLKQFFDHYLKNAQEPAWIKEGIPAIDKETELGYELLDD